MYRTTTLPIYHKFSISLHSILYRRTFGNKKNEETKFLLSVFSTYIAIYCIFEVER